MGRQRARGSEGSGADRGDQVGMVVGGECQDGPEGWMGQCFGGSIVCGLFLGQFQAK